jgi:hypothetical protein
MAPTTNGGHNDASGWAGVAKWVVIGILGLTSLFLFREDLHGLLIRATHVKIWGLEVITADTPVGKVEVSSVQVKLGSPPVEGIQASTYISRQYGFQISWPDGTNWRASDTLGRALAQKMGLPPTVDIPIVILSTQLVEGFRPNVNVEVEDVGNNETANQYMDVSVQSMKKMGWVILSSSVDEATQGGLLVFLNTSAGNHLYQFQRYAISHGRAYVVTASQLPPEDLLSQELREQLRSILNSFRLVT